MKLNVLLIGGGGREHAMANAIRSSGGKLYSFMENRNPGIMRISEMVAISKDIMEVLKWKPVKNGIVEYAIVGPEAPLEKGIVNMLENMGIKCASPTMEAAQIETSKRFMRNIMKKYSIPGNVESHYFYDEESLKLFMRNYEREFAVKPVGLTGGKGVKVQGDHFSTKEEGIAYAIEVIREGIGEGKGVLIEEKMVGEEYTLQAFTDGRKLIPMPIVQDFKRALENDEGPNTGGMGSYSMGNHSLPFLDYSTVEKSIEILELIIKSMEKEGIIYKGTIYGQFMRTKYGPRVIEINARFGDPEAINVLTIFRGDFVNIIDGIANGNIQVNGSAFSNESTVVKYLVPPGYGTKPLAGLEFEVDEDGIKNSGALLYYGSVDERDGKLYTTHSRTIAIAGKHGDIMVAEGIAEDAVKYVKGNLYHRRDIGKRETIEKKVKRMEEILKDP